MFYDHNQVEDLLICVNCGERYDIPLLLPCWKTICNKCVNNKTELDDEGVEKFACPFCLDKTHEIPDSGYAVNDALNSLLKLKPVDVSRADLFKKINDLLKKLQLNLADLNAAELNIKLNLYDYFDLIKQEIETSARQLIEQALKLKESLIEQVDYLKKQSVSYFNGLFESNGKLDELKLKSDLLLQNTMIDTNLDEFKLNALIRETSSLNTQLGETKQFIQNAINSRKIVFNKLEPANIIGQIEFQDDLLDHRLKVKLMNEYATCRELSVSSTKNLTHVVPVVYERLVLVSKSSYDEYSDYLIQLSDLNGRLLEKNLDNTKCRVNTVGSYSNFILVALTDQRTGRDIIKLYNSSLKLITSIISEFKCEEFLFNDSNIYVKLDSNYPYCYKFDYNLTRQPMFENITSQTDLFISFVVDKLVFISSSCKIYFNDKCFSRLKVFNEMNGDLLSSTPIDGLREFSVRMDASLSVNEQFVCLNKEKRLLRCYRISDACLLSETYLEQELVKHVSKFFLTNDGYFVFVDNLNDSVYFY